MNKCFYALIILGNIFLFCSSPAVCAETQETFEENSSEALEMIASQMQSLSSTLNGMPELPKLDQTIQLPLEDPQDNNSPSDKQA